MELNAHIPRLIVGFDTETTGLDTNEDEIIAYGFAVFRDGIFREEESGQFFASTDRPIHPQAQQVHGLSADDLRTRTSRWGGPYSTSDGLQRAVEILTDFRDQNAVIVGAFPKFDFDMLGSMMLRHLNIEFNWSNDIKASFKFPEYFNLENELIANMRRATFHSAGNPASKLIAMTRPDIARRRAVELLQSTKKEWPRIVDVCAFDRVHWPDLSRRRGLQALCDYYDIEPGNHDALQDARAAVEVWIRQMQIRTDEYSDFAMAIPHVVGQSPLDIEVVN